MRKSIEIIAGLLQTVQIHYVLNVQMGFNFQSVWKSLGNNSSFEETLKIHYVLKGNLGGPGLRLFRVLDPGGRSIY